MVLKTYTHSCIKYWLACYVITLLHSYSLDGANNFLYEKIILPVLGGAVYACVSYFQKEPRHSEVEDEAKMLGSEKYLAEMLDFSTLIPIVITAIVLVYSQINGSYGNAYSWTICLGVLIGGELGIAYKIYRNKA